ncbi:MAG: DNA repair protein RecN [Bacteroidia bacterium]|nr:DNA repair protein RecN [Bacteroidia bacterium]
MLKHLTIKNYALIEHLEVEPDRGLNVITGETGAGKSIVLGALGLLMGNRAETKVLWNENEKCVTEAIFDISAYKMKRLFKAEDLDYDEQTVIRREISPGGKSRAFINDTPVTLDVMKRIGGMLMDIHSQHETLQLGSQNFQLQLIDTFAENGRLLEQYEASWHQFVTLREAHDKLKKEAESLRQESDYVQFQLDELAAAKLVNGEQESLESELKIAEHSEEIKAQFNGILESLQRSEFAAQQSLTDARSKLKSIADFAPAYQKLYERLNSLLIELNDILGEIDIEEGNVDFDPERAEFVKERLSLIYRLATKHRADTIQQLLNIQADLDKKASLTANLDDALSQSKKELDAAQEQLQRAALELSAARKKILDPLCKQVTRLLKELGIPNAQLTIEHQPVAPGPTGADSIELLFSANKGVAPRPLAQVASGGEFSRLMFCLKYVMAEKTSMPTLVLDEIDTGVSGEIAIKMGKLMKSMSSRHQLIAISHLPQIAAMGHAQYFVYKDHQSKKTSTRIRQLESKERIHEIARMIGGDAPSKVAIQNAEELLSNG